MLSKKKIRLMSKIAMYEKHHGREDLKISSYYKKDYSSLNTLISILWVTVGYVMIVAMIAFLYMEVLLENLTVQKLAFIIGVAVVGYLIVLIIYGISASSFYNGKHTKAKQRVKKYYRNLSRLEKMNEREKNR